MDPSRNNFYTWTDLARLIAAFLVVISHSRDVIVADYGGQQAYLPLYALTGFGHSGVIIFFVLSGFWISRSVLRRIDRPGFWRDYAIDRLSRLWIVLIPALLLGALLDFTGAGILHLPVYAGNSGAHSITGVTLQRLTVPILLGNICFLQGVTVPMLGSNSPLWSLAYEFWYYVWFPALVLLLRYRRPTLALAGFAVAVIEPGIAWGFVSWLAGFVLLRAIERSDAPAGPSAWWCAAAVVVFLVALLLGGVFKGWWWFDPILATAFAVLLYVFARARVPFPAVLRGGARYGAKASFSLYAIHFPIVALIGGWIAREGRLAPGPTAIAAVAGITCLCIAIGWLFARCTEFNTALVRDWLRGRFAGPVASPDPAN